MGWEGQSRWLRTTKEKPTERKRPEAKKLGKQKLEWADWWMGIGEPDSSERVSSLQNSNEVMRISSRETIPSNEEKSFDEDKDTKDEAMHPPSSNINTPGRPIGALSSFTTLKSNIQNREGTMRPMILPTTIRVVPPTPKSTVTKHPTEARLISRSTSTRTPNSRFDTGDEESEDGRSMWGGFDLYNYHSSL